MGDGDQTMRDLIMNKMEKREYNKESVREHGDFTNLFRSEIFGIFPNLKTIIIQSTRYDGKHSYSLCMQLY